MIGTVTDHIIPIECTLCRGRWMVWVKRPHPSSMLPDHNTNTNTSTNTNTNSTSVSTISTTRQFTVSRQLAYPRSSRCFPLPQVPPNANMVAIKFGQKQLTGASKDELQHRQCNESCRLGCLYKSYFEVFLLV